MEDRIYKKPQNKNFHNAFGYFKIPKVQNDK